MTNKDINTEKSDLDELTSAGVESSTVDAERDEQEEISYRLADLNTRALAFFIDLVIVTAIALIAYGMGMFFLDHSGADLDDVFLPVFLILFFLASSYSVVLNGYSGRTLGKILMGIRVVSDEGDNIGFWQSFVRWIGYYISAVFLFIGFLWSFFDTNSQAWHDKLAGTYVVKD